MAGFAEILGGIGEAMREDRIREQEQGERRSKGIADLLMQQAQDENLTPGEQAQSRQAALRILQTGKVGKQDEQMLVDSVLRMNMPAPPPTQAPMPQQGEAAATEPFQEALPPPPGSAYRPGSVADMKARQQSESERQKLKIIEDARQASAKAEDDRKQARADKVLADLKARGVTVSPIQEANIRGGFRLEEFSPPPTQVQRPLVVGKNLVSPTGEVLFTAKEDDKLDPNLSFERHEDQITGNVTVIGRDPKTGAEKFRNVEKGVSRNRPSTTNVSVYAGQEVEPYVSALAKGEMTLSQVPLAIRDKVLKQANAQGIKIVSDVERQAIAQTGKITPVLSSISELSEKINTGRGVLAKVTGAVERAKAQANLNDDVAEYEAMVLGFTPLVARAVGHVGVLTEQDVVSVRALFPKPEDSKSLRDRKIARLKTIMGGVQEQLKKATTEPIAGGGLTPPPAAGAGGGAKATKRYNPATGKIEAIP